MLSSGPGRVAAIIPTLGQDLDRLRTCLTSLNEQTSPLDTIVVLNSGSPPAWAEDLADVTVLTPGLNLGWAGGLAHGRSATDAEFIWLIQDDMTVHPTCLFELQRALAAEPDLAAVGPVVLDSDGLVGAGTCGGRLAPDRPIRMESWYPTTPTAVGDLHELDSLDYVASRALLVRSADWDAVGGMYPGFYPVLWGDVDFCTALRRAGRRFALTADATVSHAINGSTPRPYGELLGIRHRALFERRWFGDDPWSAPAVQADPALLRTIAVSATELARVLGREYSASQEHVRELLRQLDESEQRHAQRTDDLEQVTQALRQAARHAEELGGKLARRTARLQRASALLAQNSAILDYRTRDLARSQAELTQMQTSRSWRFTAPFRRLGRLLRG